jgi:hypothetical protein
MTHPVEPVLEPVAQAFADANATPPFLYELTPEEGREYGGMIHDLVGLNPLRHTYAAEGAVNQGIAFLRGVLGTD